MVNVASECGFTEEHYRGLQQLQRDFGPHHFNVLAFPCNQFGQQEPGSDRDIDGFVRRVYGVSFPLFSKIAVVGTGANNVYKYLAGELEVGVPSRDLTGCLSGDVRRCGVRPGAPPAHFLCRWTRPPLSPASPGRITEP